MNGRRPFEKDHAIFNYEYDSEGEWEEGDGEGEWKIINKNSKMKKKRLSYYSSFFIALLLVSTRLRQLKQIDNSAFSTGAIGFQLCHGDKHTIVDVKTLYIREIKF